MPKTIESKLLIKGDYQDSAIPKLRKLEDQVDRVLKKFGSAQDYWKAAEPYMGMGTPGWAAPHQARGLPPGVGYREGYGPRGPGGPPPPSQPPVPRDQLGRFAERGGFGKYTRGLGNFMGAGGALMGAASGSMLPAVGGMVSHIGGQLANMSVMGIPVGALAGLPLMGAGTMMQLAHIGAQPAKQHYAATDSAYRVMGSENALRARQISLNSKAYSPTEGILLAREMSRGGGFNAFGTMAGMRYGGYETEFMKPFFETATKTGAAGGRSKEEYDRLGRIIAASFGKNDKIVSMEQAIQTMTGLMANSSNYLADISDDQTKELAAITHWGEASGTSLLRGQRMQQTMGQIQGWIAKPGDQANDMFLWQVLSQQRPGMGYMEYRRMKESPEAIMPVLGELATMGNMGALLLSKQTGLSVTQSEAVLNAKNRGESDKELKRRLEQADSSNINFQPTGSKADQLKSFQAETEAIKLALSEGIVIQAEKMEQSLVKIAADVFKTLKMDEMMSKLSKSVEWLAEKVNQAANKPEQETGTVTIKRADVKVEDFYILQSGLGITEQVPKNDRSNR